MQEVINIVSPEEKKNRPKKWTLVRDMYPQKSKMTLGTSQGNVDVIWSFLPLHVIALL